MACSSSLPRATGVVDETGLHVRPRRRWDEYSVSTILGETRFTDGGGDEVGTRSSMDHQGRWQAGRRGDMAKMAHVCGEGPEGCNAHVPGRGRTRDDRNAQLQV